MSSDPFHSQGEWSGTGLVRTRKASGLVRAWSVFDAFVYALFSINLITLGLYIFSYCWSLNGHMVPAVIISAPFTILEVIVYACLISSGRAAYWGAA